MSSEFKPSPGLLQTHLSDPKHYVAQILRLEKRLSRAPHARDLSQDGVSARHFVLDRRNVARHLAESVSQGQYQFSLPRIYSAQLDKERLLYAFEITDWIVNGVVSSWVGNKLEARLSDRVYSYRKGRSPYLALQSLGEYVKAHREAIPDPRQRGLYVLRRDIRQYTDSIPVVEGSPLWPKLWNALSENGNALGEAEQALIREVVCPGFRVAAAGGTVSLQGIPTGSQITPVIANFYLSELDRKMESVPGGFYARFGDDFIFAHPDPAIARRASNEIEQMVLKLGLEVNAGKAQDFYFNGAGKSSSAWPEALGRQEIEYLGCSIKFDGTVGLKNEKTQALLEDLELRIKNTLRIMGPAQASGAHLCQVLNRSLDATHPFAHKYAALLHNQLNDRAQLKQLDYRIARMLVSFLTGVEGVRGFRRLPYRKIREEWGLLSLCHAHDKRNRA
jgi:hypothetical protein